MVKRLVILAFLVTGAVTASESAMAQKTLVLGCDTGETVRMTAQNQTTIVAGPIQDQLLTFDRSANDASYYISGEYALRVTPQPGVIQIEIPDFGTITCRAGKDQLGSLNPPPDRPQTTQFPMGGMSWGGIVRSQPSVNSARVTSLPEGETIEILGQADAPFYQERPWFLIRYAGRTGYHWGGIICPFGQLPGTYQVCEP